MKKQSLVRHIKKYPTQVLLLSLQIVWTLKVSEALTEGIDFTLDDALKYIVTNLENLALEILTDLPKDIRKKNE